MMRFSSSRPGYIFLITILVIGSIATATATSLLLLGWAAEQNGLLVAQSTQAYEYAQACVERGLRELRSDLSYAGSESFTFTRGTCALMGIGGNGSMNRTICAEGQSGDATRRIEVAIDTLLPSVTVQSWNDVSSFSLCP